MKVLTDAEKAVNLLDKRGLEEYEEQTYGNENGEDKT